MGTAPVDFKKARKFPHFGYNERKLRTLEVFAKAYPDSIRPEAYAWNLGKLPARAAYTYLVKLWRWGLLSRQGNPVRYQITQRGRKRLAWLRRELCWKGFRDDSGSPLRA
jgi:hypothetical protein